MHRMGLVGFEADNSEEDTLSIGLGVSLRAWTGLVQWAMSVEVSSARSIYSRSSRKRGSNGDRHLQRGWGVGESRRSGGSCSVEFILWVKPRGERNEWGSRRITLDGFERG